MLRYVPRIEVTTWQFCLEWAPHMRSVGHRRLKASNTLNDMEGNGFSLCAPAQYSGRQLGTWVLQCAKCPIKAMIPEHLIVR